MNTSNVRHHSTSFALLSVVLCAPLIAACGDDFGSFVVERDLPEQRIEGSLIGGLVGDFFEVPIPINIDLESEIAAQNAGPARSAELERITLEVTATGVGTGDEDDFAFVDRVEIYVASTDADTTLGRVLVASVSDVVEGTTTLDFDVSYDVDLLPYIEEGAQFTSESEGQQPSDDVTFEGAFAVRIHVL